MTWVPVVWEVFPRNPSEEMGGKTGKEGRKEASEGVFMENVAS